MHRHKLEKEENLYKAFQHFDKDDSGYVLFYSFSVFCFQVCDNNLTLNLPDTSQERSLDKLLLNMAWGMKPPLMKSSMM